MAQMKTYWKRKALNIKASHFGTKRKWAYPTQINLCKVSMM